MARGKIYTLATALFLALWAVTAPAQDFTSRYVDAVAQFSAGNYKQAEEEFALLAKVDPSSDAVWYYLGLSRLYRADIDGALVALGKAAELDPGNYWYEYALTLAYRAGGDVSMLTKQYEKMLSNFPEGDGVVYDLLSMYVHSKEYDKALELLDRIETSKGPREQIATTRYQLYRQMGREDEAVASLRRFCEDYSSAECLSILGDYYLEEYNDSLALSCYREALSLDGSYIPAMLGESEVYRTTRRYPEYFRSITAFMDSGEVPAATKGMYVQNLSRSVDPKIIRNRLSDYDSVVAHMVAAHPLDSTVLVAAGSFNYNQERPAEAAEYLRVASETYPESLSLTVLHIQLLQAAANWTGMRDASIAAFNRFHEIGFMDYINFANFNLEDWDAIIGNCRYLIERKDVTKEQKLGAWSLMGDAYHSKGEDKQAYKAYDKALKIDPDYAPVLNNYAYYLSVQGKKLNKAYKMSKKTIEKEPDNATYLDTFAWILHLQGKDLEAKAFFKHAMLYGGKDSAVILEHYATVLEALGENDLAKVYRNQAKRLSNSGQ